MTAQRIRTATAIFLSLLALIGVASVAAPALALARARNTIAVIVPKHIKRNKTYDITVTGYAGTKAEAYVFEDYSRCSASFAAEDRRAPSEISGRPPHYAVAGKFADTSAWSSSLTGSDHACAYVVALGTKHVLAAASATFEVH